MPQRRTVAGVSLVALLALAFATVGNVLAIGNALAARDNCRRIQKHSDRTRQVFVDSLNQLDSGSLDDDYRRFYGRLAEERKEEQRKNLVHQIEVFGPIDCTVTIVRWIKGD